MQKRFVAALGVAFALQCGAVLAADAGTQFNLVCRYRSERITGDAAKFSYQPADRQGVSYRVDLRAGKYCKGLCQKTFAIAEANATHVVLHAESQQSSDPDIARITHAVVLELASKRLAFAHTGAKGDKVVWGVQELFECTAEQFTGFP